MDSETSEAIQGLRSDLRDVEVRLRSEFRAGLAEHRRHADVLFEAIRDDIRMLAEGVAALAAKVDTLKSRNH